MPSYKTPMSRLAVRKEALELFTRFLDEKLGQTDQDDSPFNRMDDEMHGTYQDLVQDGERHKNAMETVREQFFDELKVILSDGLENALDDIGE